MRKLVYHAILFLLITGHLCAQNVNVPVPEEGIKRGRKDREKPERSLIIKRTQIPSDKKWRVSGNWIAYATPFDDKGGKGMSEDSPIIIETAGHLAYLSQQVNNGNSYAGKHFRLTADINLGEHEWTPIGYFGDDYADHSKRFCGYFHGEDHKIENLICTKELEHVGLFGVCGAGSYIENLGLTNCYVRGRLFVGGLVGEMIEGTIFKCYVMGDVIGTNECVGGITGINNGAITNSYSSASIYGNSNDVGGLAGVNGDRMMGVISNCHATGAVFGYWNVGGLVGRNNSIISNCNASGNVTGEEWVGGLVGWTDNGMIVNSYAGGDVKGYFDVGGLVGFNGYQKSSVKIDNCYATGAVTGNGLGNYCIGGLAGYSGGTISNSYASGQVSGEESVGGLVGEQGGQIIKCYATSQVNGSFDVGGLIGFNGYPGSSTVVENSYSTGAVTGYRVFNYSIGGLVGYSGGMITRCYASGPVSGEESVGGLVGEQGGTLVDSYAKGMVQGKISAGGLVGWNWAKLNTCYAIGAVKSEGNAGGLIGENHEADAVITHCFFDKNTTGQEKAIGMDENRQNEKVIAKTTEELFNNSLPEGFDTKVWDTSEGNYPMLKVFAN